MNTAQSNVCLPGRSGHAEHSGRLPLLTDTVEKGLVILGEQ